MWWNKNSEVWISKSTAIYTALSQIAIGQDHTGLSTLLLTEVYFPTYETIIYSDYD